MTCWVIINNRPIIDVAIPIPTLWIGQVRNDAVRLQESVDIRRTRQFSTKSKVVKVHFSVLENGDVYDLISFGLLR